MTYYTDTDCNTAIQRPSIIARIIAAVAVHKQRKALCALTNTQLNDIGLSHEDVRRECAKSLWANPAR
ncbi:MAG: DUF1127 domain-containing protein [Rhodobacterales bacterium]